MSQEVKPIAVPGKHERLFTMFLETISEMKNPEVLEVGAGHGAFSQKLHNAGYKVSANDLFPELFKFDKIECLKVDVSKPQPYEDNSFDAILAIEVMEHIHDHQVFFNECYRILRPGGVLAISTPNILSLKSRIRFLHSGFFYSFKPLDHSNQDGMQHIASITADQYTNLGKISGFNKVTIRVDRKQSTSVLLSFLIPAMWMYCKIKKIKYSVHNQWNLLTGRVLFVQFKK